MLYSDSYVVTIAIRYMLLLLYSYIVTIAIMLYSDSEAAFRPNSAGRDALGHYQSLTYLYNHYIYI